MKKICSEFSINNVEFPEITNEETDKNEKMNATAEDDPLYWTCFWLFCKEYV